MQNVIRREISINAAKERIYEAISDPEQVVQWFPERIFGNYSVGSQPVFDFGSNTRNPIAVVAAQPYDYFAFRWVPGSNTYNGDVLAVANTLVEFRIEDLGGGICKVTLTESGFADLPASAYHQNVHGWDMMMDRLLTYLEAE
jgi:uncharacterized protein YndB with AHSA1/START domain